MTTEPASTRARNVLLGAQLMQLLAAGATITEAAKQLGIQRTQAHRLMSREMRRVLDDHADVREQVFAQELENLRILRKAIMQRALKGEPRAVEVAAMIGRDYRSLLGMTEALKVDVSIRNVDDAIERIIKIVEGEDIANVQPLRRYTAIPNEREA